MNYNYLSLACLLLLISPGSLFADENKDFYEAMRAGSLTVSSKITIPAGQNVIYFQDGQIADHVDVNKPYCKMRVKLYSADTRYVVNRGHKISFKEHVEFDLGEDQKFLATDDIFVRKVLCEQKSRDSKYTFDSVSLGEARKAFGNYVNLNPAAKIAIDSGSFSSPRLSHGLMGR